jgi:hypothetical protein
VDHVGPAAEGTSHGAVQDTDHPRGEGVRILSRHADGEVVRPVAVEVRRRECLPARASGKPGAVQSEPPCNE